MVLRRVCLAAELAARRLAIVSALQSFVDDALTINRFNRERQVFATDAR